LAQTIISDEKLSAVLSFLAHRLFNCSSHLSFANSNTKAAPQITQEDVNVLEKATDMMSSVDVVFLAVKPQIMDSVLKDIFEYVQQDQIFISIAAGKSLENLAALLPSSKIARVMPNLAASVSESMNAYCVSPGFTATDKALVESLLKCFGKVLELPEEQFDAVTAISGSGPAFMAYFLQLMIEGAVALGLSDADAAVLAKQTMLGTAKVLIESGIDIPEFIASVSSKGGTTEAGMEIMRSESLSKPIARTLQAAAGRSEELRG
jgi:pyrroline-5-carboxylate reductase